MNDSQKPFSSQWYAAPASRRMAMRAGASMRRKCVAMLNRTPSPHALRIVCLVMLVFASPLLVHPRTVIPHAAKETTISASDLMLHEVPTAPAYAPVVSMSNFKVAAGSEQGPLAMQPAQVAAVPTAVPTAEPEDGALLPQHRILLVYGLPGDPTHGVVGRYDTARLLEILQEKAIEFQAIDPDRPVVLGIQIIASEAQKTPGSDGSYLRDTSTATIYKYIEFTRSHGMILVLDAQIGRRSVPDDVQRLHRYLLQDHVHLALDPQFSVDRTEIPTQDDGCMTAADIRWVQDYLVELASTANIPPKILIVHQFTEEMIENRPLLRPVHGVQLVINVGLWGSAEDKSAAYQQFVSSDPVQFGGIMISGAWDTQAMLPEDVINLPHAPEIVLYQ